jgi:hypothetical protein
MSPCLPLLLKLNSRVNLHAAISAISNPLLFDFTSKAKFHELAFRSGIKLCHLLECGKARLVERWEVGRFGNRDYRGVEGLIYALVYDGRSRISGIGTHETTPDICAGCGFSRTEVVGGNFVPNHPKLLETPRNSCPETPSSWDVNPQIGE